MKFVLPLILLMLSTSTWSEIKFSKKVPRKQRKLLEQDLERLEGFRMLPNLSQEAQELFNMSSFDTKSFYNWLDQRVSYVLGEEEELEDLLFLENNFQTYPNPDLFPTIPDGGKTPSGTVKTVMSNLGMAVYFAGKKSQQLLGFKFKKGILKKEKVVVRSPRVGLIKVGEGLFFKPLSEDKDSYANTVSRLGTFYHEARHSDGNGTHLGFTHDICPKDHDFEGYFACDFNLNGPYTVGANAVKIMLERCASCSHAEKERLNLLVADSFSRVVKEKVAEPSQVTGDFNLSTLQLLLETKKMLLGFEDDPLKKEELEKEIADLERQIQSAGNPSSTDPTVIKAQKWDAAPESI